MQANFQHNYSSFICPFESGKSVKERKKVTKSWISQKQKELFRWNKKTLVLIFEMLPFGKTKNRGHKL